MTYKLGSASLKKLEGVHPDLVKVVKRAIEITTQDFSVTDGVRTLARQKELVAKGASKTMNSMHLKQKDGLGHAVDLVPYVNGRVVWDWNYIWPVAKAVQAAAKELGVTLTWGSVWDKPLTSLSSDLKAEVEGYKKRRAGKSVFLDGPHYQL